MDGLGASTRHRLSRLHNPIRQNRHLAPFRAKRLELEAKPHYVKEILDMGRVKVLEKAEETMKLVREAMKINY